MKLPQTMIDRACKAYWAEAGTFVSTEERIHAALEAALGQCEIISFGHSMRDEKPMRYEGKRVALVVLDD